MSIADDEEAQDPWTLPPSRKRRERSIEGPLPKTVQIVRANLVYVETKGLPPLGEQSRVISRECRRADTACHVIRRF